MDLFFYGASQNQVYKGGAILHLSETHYFHIQMDLGSETNNFIELSALNVLLCFAIEKNCKNSQIFEDSMNVINWINKVLKCHNIFLLV